MSEQNRGPFAHSIYDINALFESSLPSSLVHCLGMLEK